LAAPAGGAVWAEAAEAVRPNASAAALVSSHRLELN
jgi:hypothetical protein